MTQQKRTLYVCNRCNAAYCHPLKHCYECPGELVQRSYPFDWDKALKLNYSKDFFTNWIKSLGLHLGGV
jgi:hypothetical protein